MQRARKLAQIVVLKLPQFLAARQKTCSCTDRLRLDSQLQLISPDLSTTMPRAPKRRPLTGCRRLTLVPCRRPPPLSLRLSRLRRWSEGTEASPHPLPSCRRWGRSHPSSSSSVATTTLCVARPPPVVAPSNICSRSRQRDNIAAPAIVAAARQTSVLAMNAAAALLLARGTLLPTAVMADAVPLPPPRLATRPPQQHVDCHFPFKA